MSMSSKSVIELESKHSAHNYHPLPIVFDKAQGSRVHDPEGKMYYDFLSAYSAVNQGHCHPKIIDSLINQAKKLTLSSRAFYNSTFGEFAKYITDIFKYDMVLPMNTGAEAVETSLKLARRWAYMRKNIPENEALIFGLSGNFHGRTIGVISMSTDTDSTDNYGPFLDGVSSSFKKPDGTFSQIKYNDIDDLKSAFELHGHRTAALIVEPIQGEAGIIVPDEGYLKNVELLCKQFNILFICDEIQTGLGRTGKMLCCHHSDVRPDVVLLGKALSGGVYPVSAVLADKDIMLTITSGSHGSTFGGNPLGSAVAISALKVIIDENLCENSEILGEHFRNQLRRINSPLIATVRGKGLLNALVIDETKSVKGRSAWDLCILLKHYGVLAKPTHQNIIRLAPPLVISKVELDEGLDIIEKALHNLDALDEIPQ